MSENEDYLDKEEDKFLHTSLFLHTWNQRPCMFVSLDLLITDSYFMLLIKQQFCLFFLSVVNSVK